MAQAREEWEVARPILVENVRQKARDGLEKTAARFGVRRAPAPSPTAAPPA
jgi:hypothetical protein